MSNMLSDEQRVMLYIRARNRQMQRNLKNNTEMYEKIPLEEIQKKTGININKIKGVMENVVVSKGLVDVVEKSGKEKREEILKYVNENPGVYIFKIPIELVGIDIDFVKGMVASGELIEEEGKLTVNKIDELQAKFKRLKLALALFPGHKALKHELSAHTGVEIEEIEQMKAKGLFKEEGPYIKENTAIERNKFKKQLQVDTINRKIDKRRLEIREDQKILQESERRRGFHR